MPVARTESKDQKCTEDEKQEDEQSSGNDTARNGSPGAPKRSRAESPAAFIAKLQEIFCTVAQNETKTAHGSTDERFVEEKR